MGPGGASFYMHHRKGHNNTLPLMRTIKDAAANTTEVPVRCGGRVRMDQQMRAVSVVAANAYPSAGQPNACCSTPPTCPPLQATAAGHY